eukprot:gnl/MRDRNA2_/MRDRNA2_85884_c0_seq2.p1 gnl/MRDRNA2_/MRDRNA2_85884_c0~~gnl/MRDRNA2_/MRDRNA2_85884_c0_seq2.p1  ORF type:complete len:480 (-),score=40.56 gnl/MRDRNA2_/MRDRNA2_85884_c0_seq2:118-1557(-)
MEANLYGVVSVRDDDECRSPVDISQEPEVTTQSSCLSSQRKERWILVLVAVLSAAAFLFFVAKLPNIENNEQNIVAELQNLKTHEKRIVANVQNLQQQVQLQYMQNRKDTNKNVVENLQRLVRLATYNFPLHFLDCLAIPVHGVERSGATVGVPMCDRMQLCMAKSFWPMKTSCPKGLWYEGMARADPSPQKIIMNIGCNKGADAVGMMIRWDGSETSFSLESWRSALVHAGLSPSESATGACGQLGNTHVLRQSVYRNGSSPVVYCVEAMPSNYALLKDAASSLQYTGSHGGHADGAFKIIHAAVSNVSGTIEFPVGKAGAESLGIGMGSKHATVNLTTIDDIVHRDRIMQIDILLIDTEGHDPVVLQGARNLLRAQKIRYVEFEVHSVGAWKHTLLKDVLDELDTFGYECYWAGNSGQTLRITGCWIDDYDVQKGWSNVACVLRRDVWRHILLSHSIIDNANASALKAAAARQDVLP